MIRPNRRCRPVISMRRKLRHDWAQYYDKVTVMDAQADQRLRELADAGLADDTIVGPRVVPPAEKPKRAKAKPADSSFGGNR